MRINGITPQSTDDPGLFRLPSAPNPPESLQLFRDGILQHPGEQFELDGREIRYHEPLSNRDRHLAWYEAAE